jgi:hypothetical protein
MKTKSVFRMALLSTMALGSIVANAGQAPASAAAPIGIVLGDQCSLSGSQIAAIMRIIGAVRACPRATVPSGPYHSYEGVEQKCLKQTASVASIVVGAFLPQAQAVQQTLQRIGECMPTMRDKYGVDYCPVSQVDALFQILDADLSQVEY